MSEVFVFEITIYTLVKERVSSLVWTKHPHKPVVSNLMDDYIFENMSMWGIFYTYDCDHWILHQRQGNHQQQMLLDIWLDLPSDCKMRLLSQHTQELLSIRWYPWERLKHLLKHHYHASSAVTSIGHLKTMRNYEHYRQQSGEFSWSYRCQDQRVWILTTFL